MMNYIWTALVVFSVLSAIITNNTDSLTKGILEGAENAVSISIKLLGTMALWNGISEITTASGLDKAVEKLLSPFIRLIFPSYHKTDAGKAISANITANLLGLGNAATPLGIEAMRRMKEYSGDKTANNEMVRFVVINSAALTLIPTTVASLRSLNGSEAPLSILFPVWLSGICSLTAGLITERLLSKRWKL